MRLSESPTPRSQSATPVLRKRHAGHWPLRRRRKGPAPGSGSPRGPRGREEAAGLTKAGVLREVPEELPALLLHVPAPTAAAPRRHHDARGAGVHVVGRHVKPWAGRKRGRGEGSSEAFFSGPQAPGTTEKRLGTPPLTHLPPNTRHLNGRCKLRALLSQRPRGQGAEGVDTGGRTGRQGAPPTAWPLLSPWPPSRVCPGVKATRLHAGLGPQCPHALTRRTCARYTSLSLGFPICQMETPTPP